MTMWSSYKPDKNDYFWVGIVLLMLTCVYGFWWVTDSMDIYTDQELTATTTQIIEATEDMKLK